MSSEQRTWFDKAVLGLAIVAAGCADDKGNNEEETGTEGDGDGDTGNPDTGNPDTGNPDTGDEDTGPNDIPLELELARFNKTGKFLLLRFSEPMASVDGIDPNDFRVSLATTWQYQGYYGYAYKSARYSDPNIYLGYDYYYYGYGYKPLVADLIANGKKATDILLRFVDPMEADACQQYIDLQAAYADYDAQANADAKIGLFPHYSPGVVPVQSADGEVLAAIGPEWVEFGGTYMELYGEFGWPNLDPQIEIPCTVEPP
jgi:hypothetical protein